MIHAGHQDLLQDHHQDQDHHPPLHHDFPLSTQRWTTRMSTMVIFGDDVQGLNMMVRAEIYSAPEKKITKESELRDKSQKICL